MSKLTLSPSKWPGSSAQTTASAPQDKIDGFLRPSTPLGEDERFDAVVLGAGIAGLVSANLLSTSGWSRVLVLDEYGRVGGNHIDCSFPPYTFDIGTIIFQDDSPLLAHFPELLAQYHPVKYTIGRVTPQHRVHPYPFSFRREVLYAGPLEWGLVLCSLLFWRLRTRNISSVQDYARFWIGDHLLRRSGLENYIERFSGVRAADLDRSFADKRMYWIADAASVRKRLARLLGKRESWDGNRSFVRPRAGFAPLYAVARSRLEAAGVRFALGESIRSIEKVGDEFLVKTEAGEVRAGRLVSTIPLAHTLRLCGLPEAGPLPTIELISLFFSFKGERGFAQNILYNFSSTGRWKRLTMFSDFYGDAQGRAFFGVEVNARDTDRDEGVNALEAAREDFLADVKAKALFSGDLRFEGSYRLENAYPSYPAGAAEAAARGIAALRGIGVEALGRQGGFDYLPTSRHVTLAVETGLAASGPGRS